MSSFFDGVEITWDLGTADLALKHKAAISSLYDLGQALNLSGNLSSSVQEDHWQGPYRVAVSVTCK